MSLRHVPFALFVGALTISGAAHSRPDFENIPRYIFHIDDTKFYQYMCSRSYSRFLTNKDGLLKKRYKLVEYREDGLSLVRREEQKSERVYMFATKISDNIDNIGTAHVVRLKFEVRPTYDRGFNFFGVNNDETKVFACEIEKGGRVSLYDEEFKNVIYKENAFNFDITKRKPAALDSQFIQALINTGSSIEKLISTGLATPLSAEDVYGLEYRLSQCPTVGCRILVSSPERQRIADYPKLLAERYRLNSARLTEEEKLCVSAICLGLESSRDDERQGSRRKREEEEQRMAEERRAEIREAYNRTEKAYNDFQSNKYWYSRGVAEAVWRQESEKFRNCLAGSEGC